MLQAYCAQTIPIGTLPLLSKEITEVVERVIELALRVLSLFVAWLTSDGFNRLLFPEYLPKIELTEQQNKERSLGAIIATFQDPIDLPNDAQQILEQCLVSGENFSEAVKQSQKPLLSPREREAFILHLKCLRWENQYTSMPDLEYRKALMAIIEEGYQKGEISLPCTFPPDGFCIAEFCKETLFLLEHLEKLSISNVPLGSEPIDCSKMRQLKKLTLNQCGLTCVPKSLLMIPSLQVLEMRNNDVQTVEVPPMSEGVERAPLQKLDLSNNPKLATLPDTFRSLILLNEFVADNTALPLNPDELPLPPKLFQA